MRLLNFALGVLLLVSLAPQSSAGEAEDFMAYYGWWDGNWTVTATVEGSDETQEMEMKISQHEGNCHLVEGGGTGIWGYDPKRNKWVGTGFNTDGSFFTTVLDRHEGNKITPGTKIHATYRVKNPDGTRATGDEVWHYIDANTVEVTQKTTSEAGEALPTKTFRCKRKE